MRILYTPSEADRLARRVRACLMIGGVSGSLLTLVAFGVRMQRGGEVGPT